MADERAVLKPVNGFFDGVYQLLLIPGYYLGAFFGQKGSVEFAIVGQIITLLILALIVYLIYSAQKLKNKDDS